MLYYNIVPIYVIGAGLANLGKNASSVDATFHEKHSFFIKIMLYDLEGTLSKIYVRQYLSSKAESPCQNM